MGPLKRLDLWVNLKKYEEAKVCALTKGISLSEYCREAIDEKLSHEKKSDVVLMDLQEEYEKVRKLEVENEKEGESLRKRVEEIASRIEQVRQQISKNDELAVKNEAQKAELGAISLDLNLYDRKERQKAWDGARKEAREEGKTWALLEEPERNMRCLKKVKELYGERTPSGSTTTAEGVDHA